MAIQNLPAASTLSTSDAVALFSAALGADSKATLATLLAWLQSQITDSGKFVTQYSAPATSTLTLTIAPPVLGNSVYLSLTPTGTLTSAQITLPATALLVDGQEVLVTCTQIITTLTLASDLATIVGAPASLAANGFFRLRYDAVFKRWSRVG